MNEINNPEQRTDKPSVEKTPEQLRSAESAKAQIHGRLDNAGTRESIETESPHGEKIREPVESKEKQRERIADNINSDGKENSDSKVDSNKTRESEHWKKYGEICNEAFKNSSAKIEKDTYGNDYKELTRKEKENLSSDLKEHINGIPKGNRGDYRIPEPEKIKGLSQNDKGETRLIEAWKPNSDGAKYGTRHMEIIRAKDENGNPTQIDRIGSNRGNYFSPMKENGEPYSVKERATGDYLPEKKIEDNDSYHKYEVKQDFTRENFEKAIDKTYTDLRENEFMKTELNKYYDDAIRKTKTKGHDGDAYKYEENCPNGVKSGEIDNMFGTKENPDGGGKQYIAPFNAKELEKMGMIEEIKKEDYR